MLQNFVGLLNLCTCKKLPEIKTSCRETCTLKVLDQITLENKFCLNFKIRSVFILVAHPKLKNYRFISCFEVVGENDAYVIYCFIECGYHSLLLI